MERGGARRRPGRRAGRAPGPPDGAVITVVKVGGGLAREAGDDALRALCRTIGEAGARHRLLVVPGGGGLADAVRDHDRASRCATRRRTGWPSWPWTSSAWCSPT